VAFVRGSRNLFSIQSLSLSRLLIHETIFTTLSCCCWTLECCLTNNMHDIMPCILLCRYWYI